MSLKANLLRANNLRGTITRVSASDRVRLRLKEELLDAKVSQRELVSDLKWKSQSRLAKVLNGRVELTVDDTAAIAAALGISLVEAVRDRGVEFCADLTPSELRMIQLVRKRGPNAVDAVLSLLDSQASARVQGQHTRRKTQPDIRLQAAHTVKTPLRTEKQSVTTPRVGARGRNVPSPDVAEVERIFAEEFAELDEPAHARRKKAGRVGR